MESRIGIPFSVLLLCWFVAKVSNVIFVIGLEFGVSIYHDSMIFRISEQYSICYWIRIQCRNIHIHMMLQNRKTLYDIDGKSKCYLYCTQNTLYDIDGKSKCNLYCTRNSRLKELSKYQS